MGYVDCNQHICGNIPHKKDVPGIPGMICMCHGKERKGSVCMRLCGVLEVRVDRGREICCLGAADGHVGDGRDRSR